MYTILQKQFPFLSALSAVQNQENIDETYHWHSHPDMRSIDVSLLFWYEIPVISLQVSKEENQKIKSMKFARFSNWNTLNWLKRRSGNFNFSSETLANSRYSQVARFPQLKLLPTAILEMSFVFDQFQNEKDPGLMCAGRCKTFKHSANNSQNHHIPHTFVCLSEFSAWIFFSLQYARTQKEVWYYTLKMVLYVYMCVAYALCTQTASNGTQNE